MHDQFLLDFTSRANDRCAKLLGLRSAPLPIEMTRGRVEGVIELLQRLSLLCRELPEQLSVPFSVDCQVFAIATRIERRKTVSEKTVRNWTADAKALEVLEVEYSSQQYGGSRWNTYCVLFARVLELVAARPTVGRPSQAVIQPANHVQPPGGNGRKRAVMISAPGAETVSDPNSVFTNVINKHTPPLRATGTRHGCIVIGPRASELAQSSAESEQHVVVSADFDSLVKSLSALDMKRADGAVAKAKSRGLTHAKMVELVELYRELSARDPRMNPAWLYRWLTGESSPPPRETAPKSVHCGGRGDGLTRQQVNAEALRARIIRQARSAGASEDEIRQRCKQAGVEY